MKLRSPHALALALALASPALARAQASDDARPGVHVGPAHGTLLVVGGGRLDSMLVGRFVQLAGGYDARILVIPTASGDQATQAGAGAVALLATAGARNVAILHTTDRRTADSPTFANQLRSARAVWFSGGRQWRLADAYLGTRTQRELFALLERGGVIGGTSAGASIQASFMVRGAPEGNTIMMAPGHEQGLGFLRGVAVDQHIITRHRESDMAQVVRAHPELLGIGIDEGTALQVRGDTATVLGRSKVAITDGRDHDGKPYYFLSAGDRFDLATRRVLQSAGDAPGRQHSASPTGSWRGASTCLVRPSACRDEDAIYRIASLGQRPDSLRLSAGKMVGGKEVVLGETTCGYDEARRALACQLPNGSVVRLDVHGDSVAGTMALSDGTPWRRISLRRSGGG